MDKLPIEIHCIIVGFVDVPTLLTCRLVCRAWNKFVETTLAKVTHVKINQSAIDDSPIPNILLGHLYEMRFVCFDGVKLPALHTFIDKKCPNVKAYSYISRPTRGANLFGLQTRLLYFETRFFERPSDCLSRFSSLIACDSNFCSFCHSSSSLQYSNICRDPVDLRSEHSSINKFTTEKLKALKWYDFHEKNEEQLVRLPDCPSLEIFTCNLYRYCCNCLRSFSYPNLKYFKCENLSDEMQPFLNSLEQSQQLRAIEIQSVAVGRTFLDFIAALEHLEYLKIGWPDTKEDHIELTLNDSLKHLSIATERAFTITNKYHERLRSLKLNCARPNDEKPIECTFPSLQEADLDLRYTEQTIQFVFSVLRSSKNLKYFGLHFSAYCSNENAREIIRLFGELIQLKYVSISIELEKDLSLPREAVVLDISRHQHLEKLKFYFYASPTKPLIAKIVIGDMDYDHLRLSRTKSIMKKQGVYGRRCIIDYYYADILPGHEGKGQKEIFSFEKLDVILERATCREEIEKFIKLMSQMNRLKHLTLSTQNWDIPLEQAKYYLKEIVKVHSLESLELNLSIEASANGRLDEIIVVDARRLSSLRKLVVKLSSEGVEPRHIQLSLLLGDCYKELEFVDENTLEGELVRGENSNSFKFVIPEYSELDFAGHMNKLRSLSIADWNLVKDTSELFAACKSIESLHMNKADQIRSLIPVLAQLEHLNRLSGQLSHTFLRMFLTRFKQPRVLNAHSSLRPTIKKIQEKNKSAHSQIFYFG